MILWFVAVNYFNYQSTQRKKKNGGGEKSSCWGNKTAASLSVCDAHFSFIWRSTKQLVERLHRPLTPPPSTYSTIRPDEIWQGEGYSTTSRCTRLVSIIISPFPPWWLSDAADAGALIKHPLLAGGIRHGCYWWNGTCIQSPPSKARVFRKLTILVLSLSRDRNLPINKCIIMTVGAVVQWRRVWYKMPREARLLSVLVVSGC